MIVKIVVCVIAAVLGIMFVACVPAMGNRERTLAIHKEMPPSASLGLANAKNAITIFAGLMYLVAIAGILGGWKIPLACGVAGAAAFIAFYVVELALWFFAYPRVIGAFAIMVSLSAAIGGYCLALIVKR